MQDLGLKIKLFFRSREEELRILLVIVLVALLSFGLGRLSVYYGEKGELKIEYPSSVVPK